MTIFTVGDNYKWMGKQIKRVDEVIDALGGAKEVADLFAIGRNAVSQWKTRGFPPETYVVMQERLARKGFCAAPALWNMRGAG